MSPKFAELRSEVLQLPEEERRRLVEELQESFDEADGTPEEIESAWGEEIARRLKKLDDGTAVLVDGEESSRRVREKLRARYGR